MDKNVKNGQNDEMDEATASLSSQKLEGPEIKILLIIFYFTCTTCTLTCITLFTLLPQHITPPPHAYTNPGCFNTIPAHMYNMPRQYHATPPRCLREISNAPVLSISHYLTYMRIQSQKHFLGDYNKVFVPLHCFIQAGITVERLWHQQSTKKKENIEKRQPAKQTKNMQYNVVASAHGFTTLKARNTTIMRRQMPLVYVHILNNGYLSQRCWRKPPS